MKAWPWGLLSTALLAGCERPLPRMPAPPLDAAAPKTIETATFGLG